MKIEKPGVMRSIAIVISIVAIGYFVLVFGRLWQASAFGALATRPVLAATAVACVFALLAHCVAGGAMRAILRAFGRPVSHAAAQAILLTSQFAKYLPGNVGPWIGRPVLAARFGVPVGSTLRSLVYESLLTIAVGGLVGLGLTAVRAFGTGGGIDRELVFIVGCVTLAVLVATQLVPIGERLVSRWLSRTASDDSILGRLLQLKLAMGYGLNFLLAGAGFALIAWALGIDLPLFAAIGGYALAWIAGFVVPGPPAGLGVREAVLIGLMHGSVDAESAAQLVVAHRLATTAADLAGFAIGVWLLRRAGVSRPGGTSAT